MELWIWIIGIIILVILILVIRNLIKTKDQPRMVRYGSSGGIGGSAKSFLLRCCGRGKY